MAALSKNSLMEHKEDGKRAATNSVSLARPAEFLGEEPGNGF